jgi:hypothetical protein
MYMLGVSPDIAQQTMPTLFRHLNELCLTTTNLSLFMFLMGFIFACVSNILIVVIWDDFCLLPAYFCYIL